MATTAEWMSSYSDIVMIYQRESDRSAAILASSVLDAFLGDAIKMFLVDDRSTEELFSANGPLSTFSSRINLAFALGLISSTTKRDLHLIRKIRNHFAHHPAEVSFDEAPARDQCAQLSFVHIIPEDGGKVFKIEAPRDHFLITISLSMLRIHQTMRVQERRSVLTV